MVGRVAVAARGGVSERGGAAARAAPRAGPPRRRPALLLRRVQPRRQEDRHVLHGRPRGLSGGCVQIDDAITMNIICVYHLLFSLIYVLLKDRSYL